MSESHQIRDAGMPLSPGLETPSATLPTATPGLARRTACLVIALVVTIGYANSLNCGFAQDDVYVTFNRTLRDLLHIYRAFAQPYWGTGYEELATYRPVVNISLALNYAVHGFHPLGYHFVNLVLHAFNCCLLYGLVYAYTRWSQLALFTALLFAAHPVHVEAVTQVVGRTELLAAGFGFLSWHAYMRIGEGRHWRWLAWAAFAGGMYAKESALTLIGVIGLAELCAGRLRTRQEWQRAALDATGYLVVAASYILIRRLVNGQFGVHGDQTFFHGDPWHTRFLTMAQGMVEYFRLLVFPYRLCAFYDFSFFPKVSTLTPRVAASLLLVAAVIGVGLRAWRRQPLVAFAILMFFVSVSLVSNIVVPTGIVIAERVLYVPSVSICLLGGLGLATLYRQSRGGRYAAVGLCVIILGLMSWRTITRNPDWTDNEAYGRALVRDAPGNPKGWLAMAKVHEEAGDLAAAEAALQHAIAIGAHRAAPRTALGQLYLRQGRLAEAEALFRAAIAGNPLGWQAYYALANLLARQGRTAEALQWYEAGKRQYVPSAEVLAGTAASFYRGGQYPEARRIYEDALRRDPLLAQAWAGYGTTLLRLHQLDDARRALEQAVVLDPNLADGWMNLGSVAGEQGDYPTARRAFAEALKLDSASAEAYANLRLATSLAFSQ
ncbi:tetratricopeptide repeat protein [Chloracidobacterium sp. MS 40/45]|uniref:tetratricopeptide repeat protein n=1 Tax=Chloracidobacterium aggregatum TaxID=2851959 RepID=UPI001B8B051A|nr:tetratricopeptide repeat protein [Chloracidobacterium aggregatum]QUV99633.1 tetratricopeptide repeat protein [Chloracidobacterium sp. MS 40/45]